MNVIYKKIKDLKEYEKNPRHNDEAVVFVANSIKEFGFKVPVIVDKDNVIVCGHTRVKAAKKLKLKEVPVIVADDLNDEQIKAFRLADNKVSEFADWDTDLLEEEISEIFDIDLQDFGFSLFDKEEEHELFKEETQRRVENILNLEHSQFEGDGKYDIPMIEPVYDLEPIKEWIGFNYVLSDDDPTGKAVHFFIDDYQFERVWNNPDKYVDKLKQYVCVAAPDFSPYGDMPLATQIFNHYRKHWVACYLQQHGVTVIPCIRSSTDERSLEFFTDGTPSNSIVILSTMWTKQKPTEEELEYDRKVYNKLLELNPSKIFVYGKSDNLLDKMYNGEIEYVKNFTSKWNERKENGE